MKNHRQIEKPTKSFMSMADFIQDILYCQKIDPSFQANLFTTRWTVSQIKKYLTNVVKDQVVGTFEFADVEASLQNVQSAKDKEYYQEWLDKGVKYINIDSNNRCINTKKFLEGVKGYVVSEGRYETRTGANVVVNKNLSDTFETLPQELKEAFEDCELTVIIYKDLTRQELSEKFRATNEGSPLNEPEKRNSILSEVANIIRTLEEKYVNVLWNPTYNSSKWFSESKVNRRDIADFIAGLLHIQANGLSENINSEGLEKMYESDIESIARKFKTTFTNFMETFFNGTKESPTYCISNKNSILDLFVLFRTLETKRTPLVLKKDALEEFIKHYKKVVTLLIDDEDFTVCRGINKNSKANFITMLGGRQNYNNMTRHDILMNKLDIDKYFEPKSPRVITDKQRDRIIVDNNFKTNDGTNQDINLAHINGESRDTKPEKGHALGKSFKDTGKTSVEDTIIQLRTDNRKQGSK